jgi:cytochrome c-type biogenesis protein CcmE
MKPKIVIGVVIIVAALVYLIAGGLKDNASYYLSVSELKARTDLGPTDGVRVHGFVDPTTIQWNPQNIELSFNLLDQGDTLRIFYKGVKPDQLADAQQAVLEGHLRADGVFDAGKIMLKCPSKYEARREGRQTE